MKITIIYEDAVPAQRGPVSVATVAPVSSPTIDPSARPAAAAGSCPTGTASLVSIKDINIKQAQLYRQRSKASNDIVRLGEKAGMAERKPLVDAVLSLQDQYNGLAEQKEYYEKHGQFAGDRPKVHEPTAPSLPTQKHELVRMRTNLASQISKAKANIKKYQHNPAKLLQYQQKEIKLKALLKEVDERLTQ